MRKLSVGFLFFLFLTATFRVGTVLGGPIENLKPSEWYEVLNSQLRSVVSIPTPPGNPAAVMEAWSSGAYDTQQDRLIIWGGGHNDYGGNELYAFDINTLSWSRIWGPSASVPATGGTCNETYSDGNPVSRHTYGGLTYIPSTNSFFAQGGSLYCGAGSGSIGTWMFNFGTPAWQAKNTTAPLGTWTELGVVSAYDSNTGHVFISSPSLPLWEFNPVANSWTQKSVSAGDRVSGGQTAAIDPTRKKFVAVGRGLVRSWDISTAGQVNSQDLTTTGDTTLLATDYPGFVYDPISDKFVGWIGGSDVYTLDMTTLVWTKKATTGTVIPTPAASNGTFGRWRYIPSKNAFIGVNSIDQDVWIYKLSTGTLSPPDTTPPSIPTNLAATAISSSQINLSWTASTDNIGVTGYHIYRGGVQIATVTTLLYSNTGLSSSTTYSYTVAALDAAGNTSGQSTSVSATTLAVPADTTPPTISLTSPSAGSTVSGTVTVSATASDNVGVVGVQFKLDGANLGIEDTTSPYSVSWDTTTTTNGSHSLTAVARDAAGNNAIATNVTITVSNAPPPTGQINIPLNTWVPVAAPTLGQGPCPNGNCKHMRAVYNPVDKRIYFLGGDWSYPGANSQNGDMTQFSYDVMTNNWRLEQPFCRTDGGIQPSHPDETGWAYDSVLHIFWNMPGYAFSPTGCPDNTLLAYNSLYTEEIMTFDPVTKIWTWPHYPLLEPTFGIAHDYSKFANYDATTRTIIQLVGYNNGAQVAIFDTVAHTWALLNSNQLGASCNCTNARLGQEYAAMDAVNRVIYVLSPNENPIGFYRYNIATQTMDKLQSPGATPTSVPNCTTAGWEYCFGLTYPVWDSVNQVVLWPHLVAYDGVVQDLLIYHPTTDTWEKQAILQPSQAVVHGNVSVFDPSQNVLMVMGDNDGLTAVPYLFLYRYGNGSGTLSPPSSPTSLQVQ